MAGFPASHGSGAPLRPVERTELRIEVVPPWPFRLPRLVGRDGLYRRRNGVLHRLLHVEGEPHHLRVAQLTSGNVLFGARGAHPQRAIAAIRRALGVDLDLREFHRRFHRDPLIGSALRASPWVRVTGRPDPFEALGFAICEQLIEYERAALIELRIARRLGRVDAASELWDWPAAAAVAGTSSALLQSFDLSFGRSVTLVRVARELERGRIVIDADAPRAVQEQGWRRLLRIPGVGTWTVEMLATMGQGRLDLLPAGDLGYIKLAGRLLSGGDPYARASEQQVRELFARFDQWQALAGAYALRAF